MAGAQGSDVVQPRAGGQVRLDHQVAARTDKAAFQQGQLGPRVQPQDMVAHDVGRRVGTRWIVESGLQAGDRVIVDAPALRSGTKVVARAAAPEPAGAERPAAAEAP